MLPVDKATVILYCPGKARPEDNRTNENKNLKHLSQYFSTWCTLYMHQRGIFWTFKFFPLINTFPQTYLSNCQHRQSRRRYSVIFRLSTLLHQCTRTISHRFKFVQNNSTLKVTVDLFMRFSTISWLESFNFWNLYCMFDKCTHLYVNVLMVTTLTAKKALKSFASCMTQTAFIYV